MLEYLIKKCKTYFPVHMRKATDCRATSNTDLVIRREDGLVFLYDDIDRTIRSLPKDSNNMTEDEWRRELGFRLRKLMLIRGLTQQELADKTGITQAMISRYITGDAVPSFYNIDRIARALDCSVDEFRYI